MRRLISTLLLTAASCVSAQPGQARPVTLACSDSVDMYAPGYKVVVDSRSMTVKIIKPNGLLAGQHAYQITSVNNASDGGYVVTASGRVLNSRIQVMVSSDEKWVAYTDALTDQLFATDYCQ